MGNIQDTIQPVTEKKYWWGRRGCSPQPQNQTIVIKEALRAAENGDIYRLKRIHSCFQGGISKVRCEKTLSTPLHCASANGHGFIVKYLLSKGSAPDSQDCSWETPLHSAAKTGATECLLILIKHKANIEIMDTWGRTPLVKAIVYNRPKCVHWLLDAGAKTNVCDSDGLSPVHVASSYGQVCLLRKLVKAGANLNVINRKGKLPISKAINAGQATVVVELLKYGARTYHQDICVVKDAITKVAQTHPAAKEADRDNFRMLDCVLSAHGFSLDAETVDLFLSLFRSLDPILFLPILIKVSLIAGQAGPVSPHHLEQFKKFLPSDFKVLSLENLARQKARESLMSSGKNVIWACAKLEIPPVLKRIILLQDIF